jgi:integrase
MLLGDDGMPLFYPTVYEVAMRRMTKASATLSSDLKAIQFLYLWAEQNNIDIEARFHKGEFLTLQEIIDLTSAATLRVDQYFKPSSTVPNPPKIRNLSSYRMSSPKRTQANVALATSATRIRNICYYLDWLAKERSKHVSSGHKDYEAIKEARNEMRTNLLARVSTHRKYEAASREGLALEQQTLILKAIDPNSSLNPWKDNFTRLRNQLFITLLLKLGCRRGEALLMRIQRDIDLRNNKLTIHRVPDDKDDPRRDEPNSKTLAREIPLDENLARMLSDYITHVRSKIKGAKRHDFLFVAAKTGCPMSKSAVTKVFQELRDNVQGLEKTLTAHILRHTWNDNFSKECDKHKLPEETEKKTRNYLMGWKDSSNTAVVYTRRHVKIKAQELSLKLQNKISINGVYDED